MALPTLGIYTAAKYAVVGVSETLRGEAGAVRYRCLGHLSLVREDASPRGPSQSTGGAGLRPGGAQRVHGPDARARAEPQVLAERVIRGVKRGDFYILPHPDAKAGFEARANEILAAFDLD